MTNLRLFLRGTALRVRQPPLAERLLAYLTAHQKQKKKGVCGGHEKEKEKRQEKEGKKDLRSRRDT